MPSNCGNVLELFDSKNFDASLLVAERELNLARLWDGKNHDGSPLTVFPSGWKEELNLGTSPGIVSCETEPEKIYWNSAGRLSHTLTHKKLGGYRTKRAIT